MKIGIVTLYANNYGNKLQNYALQETLKKISKSKDVFTILAKNQKEPSNTQLDKLRAVSFLEFSRKNLNVVSINSKQELEDFSKQLDYVVLGSDQVWNPQMHFPNELEYLTFLDPKKRITYAPSFGKAKLSMHSRFVAKKHLKNFQALSVREQEGAKIIKDLTGKDVPVLLDPTLLLTKEEWSVFAGEKPLIDGKYICTYFLGDENAVTSEIESLSQKYNYKIINLNSSKCANLYSIDPIQFVNIIKNAQLVCTDSFHGTVFSTIFEKPFIIFKEKKFLEKTSSRITTLIQKLDIAKTFDEIPEDPLKVDYTNARKNLEIERKKSFDYLKNALGLKND